MRCEKRSRKLGDTVGVISRWRFIRTAVKAPRSEPDTIVFGSQDRTALMRRRCLRDLEYPPLYRGEVVD
ncbi:hypothetical protein CKO51_02205 [Rhodopirellula sp. SM50]|nr:hypothetical protein CKO51_02205 [Rhodopirellula sp. SM50]